MRNAENHKNSFEEDGKSSTGFVASSRSQLAMLHENEISELVIGAAIEVHRQLGPGLLECVYEEALCHELHLRGCPFARQQSVPIRYKNVNLASNLRLDLVVSGKVIVDLKAKEQLSPIDKPQMLTYLRLSDLRLGLIINFHVPVLKQGITRVVNQLPEHSLRASDDSASLR